MAFVQELDFVLGLNQLIRIIADRQTNAIKVSLGVESDGRILMRAEGVLIVAGAINILSGDEQLCPVPPDCAGIPGCVNRVAAFIDENTNTGNTLNFQ